jgi:phage shock protein A
MTDTIASRVTRVVSGSVHALLDAVENAAPEATMAQAIREVDRVIDDVRAELGRVEASKHLATTQLNKLNTDHEQLAAQIEAALAQGREDLARAGLEKQLNIEDQVPVLQKSLADQRDAGKELEGYIAALLAKKREMEQALRDFVGARASRTAGPGAAAGSATGRGKSEDRVANAGAVFDRVLAKQTGLSGLTSAATGDAAKLRELQDLQRANRIEERLAQLKLARQSGGGPG